MKFIPVLLATSAVAALSAQAAHAQPSPAEQARTAELSTQLFQQQQQIDALREQQLTLELNLRSQANLALLQAQAQQSVVSPTIVPAQQPYIYYSGSPRPVPPSAASAQTAPTVQAPTTPSKAHNGPAHPSDAEIQLSPP